MGVWRKLLCREGWVLRKGQEIGFYAKLVVQIFVLEAVVLEPEVFIVDSLWKPCGLLWIWEVNPAAPLPRVFNLHKAYFMSLHIVISQATRPCNLLESLSTRG